MKIYCFDSGKSKNILAGEYNEYDYTFIKKVKSNHYMIKERGYGIQEEVLAQLKNLGCINVLIITKTGQYISLLEDWLKQPIKNYGHGKQRFLENKRRF
jgi:hypothetical protein